MALIVQKFGGTSVGDIERIQRVAQKIKQTRAQGHDVVVVVSAMNGETDRLINLAKSVNAEPDPREYAALVAAGEQVSITLLTLALIAQGCPARSYTGAQAHIRTDSHHKKARILAIDETILQADLAAGIVPVVAGFQGISPEGDITTLGRGGSDTTAVAIAAVLHADECQIYTDVDGVYTADPKVVPQAQRLEQVSFAEMLELASLGAKVIQQRAVEFAGKYQVPVRVLSSFQEGPGTLISFTAPEGMEQPLITGVVANSQIAKFTLHGLPQCANIVAETITALNDEKIEVDMLSQQTTFNKLIDLAFTVSHEDYSRTLFITQKLGQKNQVKEIVSHTEIAKLSLVGVGLRSHPAIIRTLFKILGTHTIPVHLITTSELKASVLVNEIDLERGARALHTAFGLDK